MPWKFSNHQVKSIKLCKESLEKTLESKNNDYISQLDFFGYDLYYY